MAKSIWLIALLTLGCSEEPRRFSLIGFDDDEASVIQDAASEWCMTSSYCPRVIGGDNSIVLSPHTSDCGGFECLAYTDRSKDFTPDGDTTILVLDRRSLTNWLDLLRRDVMHEFGHTGGCWEHRSGTAMAAIEEETSEHITQYDIDCVR